VKDRALTRPAARLDGPAVALDDFAAQGEPHAGARQPFGVGNALEGLEDTVAIFFIKADAFVPHFDLADRAVAGVHLEQDGDPGLFTLSMKLQAVL